MSGLFATFGVSTRGMSSQQKALQVTSHNIANANTEGYSRQRAELQTTKPFSMPSMHSAISPGQLGTGSQIVTISRIRDHFLDFQVRKEVTVLGTYEYRDRYLSEVESILNEPTEHGLSTMFGQFFGAWHDLSKQAENSNARTVVANQADALAKEINHTYSQLTNTKNNIHLEINQQVTNVNSMLNQIDDLNQQIMNVKIAGQEPNDLMDRRDLLIDKLSKAFNIDIDKKEFYSIDIKPGNTENVPSVGQELLVRKEPNYAVSRFSYINSIEKKEENDNTFTLTLKYSKLGNTNEQEVITIKNIAADKVDSIYKDIEQSRIIFCDEDGQAYSKEIKGEKFDSIKSQLGLFVPDNGEVKGLISIQKDIDKYQEELDKMAKGFSIAVNALYSPKEDADKTLFFVNNDGVPHDDMKINAKNIAINKELLENVMKIKAGSKYDGTASGASDGSRALAIAQIQQVLIDFSNCNSKDITDKEDFIDKILGGTEVSSELNGAIILKGNKSGTKTDAYFKDIVDQLGIQRSEAKRIVNNQNTLLSNFEERRASESGVSLDEEMTNLIQFQHCYQANAKIISIVDQLLDVVVNGLIR
ncbi:flagellar hook-associated protein 1 FlgK [Hathewaya proteolytica DSM 3090]|uniref:Flagellar hook-associated protein 1 n=1 Tax=Hathewaya proteolytica DSM 3090 TaxID=1121331 RepID=A0A1M6LBP0_9CLOT|nr:flagellar hook-associated protein FlgK [Hathewaya proteolytica]SHJ68640.1 flagellar hook-associated protein 1 FlgK [Hathewaya proteolytica DSM 3090]